jgi:transposase
MPKRQYPRKNRRGGLLHGIIEIAEYIDRSYNTAYRWIHEYGLPAMKGPDGKWLSHKQLILMWMLANREVDIKTAKPEDFTNLSDDALQEALMGNNHKEQ